MDTHGYLILFSKVGLQKIQITAARMVSRKKGRDHISPVLEDLHWLPIRQRIDHKILSLTFSYLNGLAQDYLAESIPRRLYRPEACVLTLNLF